VLINFILENIFFKKLAAKLYYFSAFKFSANPVNQTVKRFATIAFWEGISYVLLLGIAMPLKYYFEFPFAVKVVGWAHGVLFVAYGIMLVLCWIKCKWSFLRVVLYFFASLLPILPFIVERKLKQEYQLA
jgi:integral membrane protein